LRDICGGAERGKHFWMEFELYSAELLVVIADDIVLVGMLPPYAEILEAICIYRVS
jgi:hypothetical protein